VRAAFRAPLRLVHDPRTQLHRGLLAALPDAPDALASVPTPCEYCGAGTRCAGRSGPVCGYGEGCAIDRERTMVVFEGEPWVPGLVAALAQRRPAAIFTVEGTP
jgi:hypothetical protein